MNIEEYNKVKDFTYNEYCEYLQNKYGKAKLGYFTENWTKRKNITRTKEGLIIHHIKEDTAIMLSKEELARLQPYEYQSVDNLAYCNYLEHLLLHILIVEENATREDKEAEVGIGGIINFIVPELNDWYSGYFKGKDSKAWQVNCYKIVKDNEDTYLALIERYLNFVKDNISNIRPQARIFYNPKNLTHSFNSHFGLWEDKDNKYIYDKIQNIIKEVFKDSLVSDEETPKDTKKEKVGFLDKLKKMFIDD